LFFEGVRTRRADYPHSGDSPSKEKESNWLPSPKGGKFFMLLRAYMPGTEIVEQKWNPPGVVKVN